MVKIQEKTDINDNESKIQRTIQVATVAVIIKKIHHHVRYTRNQTKKRKIQRQRSTRASQYLFCSEIKDPILNIITPQNDTIDTLLQFLDGNNYKQIFKEIFKC